MENFTFNKAFQFFKHWWAINVKQFHFMLSMSKKCQTLLKTPSRQPLLLFRRKNSQWGSCVASGVCFVTVDLAHYSMSWDIRLISNLDSLRLDLFALWLVTFNEWKVMVYVLWKYDVRRSRRVRWCLGCQNAVMRLDIDFVYCPVVWS